jgi:hypothetical protein
LLMCPSGMQGKDRKHAPRGGHMPSLFYVRPVGLEPGGWEAPTRPVLDPVRMLLYYGLA